MMKLIHLATALPLIMVARAAPIKREASRSTYVMITTSVETTLTLTDSGLFHGEWSDGMSPPQTIIDDGNGGSYQAESDGLWTGDAGYTTYVMDDGTQFAITFANPYDGANTYSCDISGEYASYYNCYWEDGSGDNAAVGFQISYSPRTRATTSTITVKNQNGDWSLSPISQSMTQGEFVTYPGGVSFANDNSFQIESINDQDGDAGTVVYQMNNEMMTYYGNPSQTQVTIAFSTDANGNTNWQCFASQGPDVECQVTVGQTQITKDLITTSIDFGIYQ